MKRHRLTQAEYDLWLRAMQGTHRLRPHEQPDLETPAPKHRPVKTHPARPAHNTVPVPKPKPAPPAEPFVPPDGTRARQIRRGRVGVDAKLDLHGMRQSEAHAELTRFILTCHAKDRRCALIITGKGGRRTAGDDFGFTARHCEDGVLRRQVPLWLAQEPLRSKVLTLETAHQRDGGSGAYYVFLRKHRTG